MTRTHRRLLSLAKSSAVAIVSVVAIYLLHNVFSNSESSFFTQASLPDETLQNSPFNTVPLSAQLNEAIAATKPVLSEEIEALSGAGNFQRAKNKLMDRALAAVAAADNSALALQLSELGELALLQGELGMAEVYLSEALELYEQTGEELKVAGIHIQKGRLHLFARQRARQASDAYDQLLLARWKISHDRFSEAEEQLKKVVKDNLALHRYGAAASAYETLFTGYSKDAMNIQAQQAGIDAIKLHAASGNEPQVNRLVSLLRTHGMTEIESEQLLKELQPYYSDYDASVRAIGAARDYAQLYNQLSSKGDALQAWRFRMQAEQSLANASKRAQYRRQPDVLVELYRSNKSMDSAIVSLKKASAVYSRYGIDDGVRRSKQLRAQIF